MGVIGGESFEPVQLSGVVMLDQGQTVEDSPPAQTVDSGQTGRAHSSVGKILRH
jgi:hypothetical protein